MTIKIDEDFTLAIIVGILAILFTFFHTQTMFISTHEATIEELVSENTALFSEVSAANREITTLTRELNDYHISQASLERLGASPVEAQRALMASEVYGLDPKPMGAS
jgi:hypothetical protein